MSIGDLILRMTSKTDPRAQLAAALTPQGAAPQGVPAGAGGGAATAAPAGAQAQPEVPSQAPASPPDLASLYSQLMERQERASNINSSLGLIASAFAQPENKDRLMNAFTGDGATDASTTFNNFMSIRNAEEQRKVQQDAIMQKTAARNMTIAQLPSISARTGVSVGELRAMLDAGTLGNFLSSANARSEYTEVTDAATGTSYMVDKNNPTQRVAVGGAKPVDPKFQEDGAGNVLQVNPDGTTAPFGAPAIPTDTRTPEKKNYDVDMEQRTADGRPIVSYDIWLTEDANRRASRTTINNNPASATNDAFGKTLVTDYEAARGSSETINTLSNAYGVLQKGIVNGSMLAPLELESRKVAGSIFGLDDETVTNTELYQSAMGDVVLNLVKELGTGNSISNADRDFAAQIAGGNITLNGESMARILALREKASRANIIRYNRDIQAEMGNNPQLRGRLVDMPPPSRALLDRVDGAVNGQGVTAVDELMANRDDPNEIAEFNSVFGPGVAEYILGTR